MTDWSSRLDRLKRSTTCAFRGHEKTWSPGFFGPTWHCPRCGRNGGLEEHSQLPIGQHLVHLGVAGVVLVGIWLLLRWIF